MWYGFLLIITVISISGFIAYLGDQIGMKVGKKRISIFGLRPKYTSIIITVLTGVLIAILTLGIILMTNNIVRQALFRIQEVLVRIENLEEQRSSLQEQMELLQGEKDDLAVQSKLARDQYNKTISRERSKLEELRVEQEELNQEIAALNQEIVVKNEQITQLDQRKEELERTVSQLRDAYMRMQYYYLGEDIVYQRGDVIYSKVINAQLPSEELVDQLSIFLEEANQEVKKKSVTIVDEENDIAFIVDRDEVLNLPEQIRIKGSEKVIVRLEALTNVLKNDLVPTTFRVLKDFIVFEQDQLIESAVIDASKNPVELENELKELFSLVSARAVKEGLLAERGGAVTINFSQFYEILKLIQLHRGAVEVKVLAIEDIWREDKLSDSNLRFEIQALSGEVSNDPGD